MLVVWRTKSLEQVFTRRLLAGICELRLLLRLLRFWQLRRDSFWGEFCGSANSHLALDFKKLLLFNVPAHNFHLLVKLLLCSLGHFVVGFFLFISHSTPDSQAKRCLLLLATCHVFAQLPPSQLKETDLLEWKNRGRQTWARVALPNRCCVHSTSVFSP